ncbi:hypothetical protein KKA53_01445 [Candidatus Dependentiae bacterium]|nr:hypothetical protein [Candidatus Dependentiae bacterium]
MKKKISYALFICTIVSGTTPTTMFATFTCWDSNCYMYKKLKSVFEAFTKEAETPAHSQAQTSNTHNDKNNSKNTPYKLNQAPCNHKHCQNNNYSSQKNKFERKSKHECCSLYTGNCTNNDLVEITCCKSKDGSSKKICKTCLEKIKTPQEEVQDPSSEAFYHPEACHYAEETNQAMIDQTLAYEQATPDRNPSLAWKKIGQHWYFLEDNRYWRYTGTNTSYNSANAAFWRYIPVARISCPFCRRTITTQ